MAQTYFPEIKKIAYEGPQSKNPLSFKHYKADEVVLGKTMAEHLRYAVCYWHTVTYGGQDPFGPAIYERACDAAADPIQRALDRMDFFFEVVEKLGIEFWTFHDRDIAPEADTLTETNKRLDRVVDYAEKKMAETGVKLLWGTTNAFSHRRFMEGAGTNPNPHVFAYAGAQIKKAMELTHRLKGEGYVFWGGREGYHTLLNTNMGLEMDHLARLLHMAVDYKKEIGFAGQLYIEPKPKEPTKHQYDFDSASCHAFLQKYGLVGHLKMNVEANHATLAAHNFQHELEYCVANDMLGSVDANEGDMLLGWDTDEFPTNLYETALAMVSILRGGGFTTGGLNFDARLRRCSIDPVDLFHAHIGGMDAFARGLKIAAKMKEDGRLDTIIKERYAGWSGELGQKIESGKAGLADMEKYVLEHGEPTVVSGRQEMIKNLINEYI